MALLLGLVATTCLVLTRAAPRQVDSGAKPGPTGAAGVGPMALVVGGASPEQSDGGWVERSLEEGEVEQVAVRLLASYRDRRDCVLASSGYLDLFGSVWSCVVRGDGWVDVCLVTQVEEGRECQVSVMRLDADEVGRLFEEDLP